MDKVLEELKKHIKKQSTYSLVESKEYTLSEVLQILDLCPEITFINEEGIKGLSNYESVIIYKENGKLYCNKSNSYYTEKSVNFSKYKYQYKKFRVYKVIWDLE